MVAKSMSTQAKRRKWKNSSHPDFSSCEQSNGNRIFCKSWKGLTYLSLWIGAGELLTPLPMTGLDVHPNLEEIRIRVERDCRSGHKPSKRWAALLVILDCQRCSWIAYKRFCINHTMWAGGFEPVGEVLLEWNREFKPVWAFDYWPPQEFKPVSQRSLSLPGAGLLAECLAMRHLLQLLNQ